METWAEIEDFPGYAVSMGGEVMNLRTQRILKPRNNSYGYSRVALRRDGETHDVYVHRLVAKAFLTGYRFNSRIQHYKDNSDNRIRNLHFQGGKRVGIISRHPKKAKMRHIRIIETGEIFHSVEACARHIGGDPSTVYRVLRGERTQHRGYSFEFYYEEPR